MLNDAGRDPGTVKRCSVNLGGFVSQGQDGGGRRGGRGAGGEGGVRSCPKLLFIERGFGGGGGPRGHGGPGGRRGEGMGNFVPHDQSENNNNGGGRPRASRRWAQPKTVLKKRHKTGNIGRPPKCCHHWGSHDDTPWDTSLKRRGRESSP